MTATGALDQVWVALNDLLAASTHPTVAEQPTADKLQDALATYTVAYCAERGIDPADIDVDTDPLGRLAVRLGMKNALSSR